MELSWNDIAPILDNRIVRALLVVIAILCIQLLLRSPIETLVRRIIRTHKYSSKEEERKREDTLINVFRTASSVVLWIVGVVVILFQLEVDVAGLLAGAGIVGVLIGFGAQSTVRDFFSGIFIIMENQYRVGDIVKFSAGTSDGVAGVVEDITVRITKLRDLDGNLHIISNGSLGVVTNMTFMFANVNVDIPVSYEADIKKVQRLIDTVGIDLAGDSEWGKHISEAVQFLRVDGFGESTVTVKALGKVHAGMQWDVAGEFRRRLMLAFEKEGTAIPYPHLIINKEKQ